MSTLHQYIAIIGCFQGLLLFTMLTFDSRVSPASRVLGFFCLVLGVTFLLPFMTYGIAPSETYGLAAWVFFFPVAYGPLFFLYCRNALLNRPLCLKDLVHALPVLACYLLNIDTLLFAHEAIRTWIVGSSAPTLRIWFSEYLLFIFAISYSIATVRVIWRYQRRARNTLSSYNPDIFKWMWTLVVSIFSIWLAKGVMSFSSLGTPLLVVFSDALIVMFIYLIALVQWRNPGLFTIEHLSDVVPSKQQSSAYVSPSSTTNPTSISEGILTSEDRALLFESVKQHVEESALFRESDLTLSGLAAKTGLSAHHLSEVLNQHAGKNFNQFINDYRITDVCERLKNDRTKNVLDIALESGFSSKSTFNTIFKKHTGSTPTQYRKALVDS